MSTAVESYRNFGALALGMFWLTTFAMIYLLKAENDKSISGHAASVKKSALLFGVVSAPSATLFGIFFVKWFTPTFQLGTIYNAVVLVMLALFGLAGVVPDVKGVRHRIHVGAAMAASVLLLPAMVMMSLNDHTSLTAQIFTTLALTTMLYISYLFTVRKRIQNKMLIYEAVYFLCFDLSVLVTTYS